ncbi:interactor of HORMAD1 protein 1 [Bos indicus]|uniref:Interactor of HORMAD1 1 n=2 Tax=Bos TaxID=9903 RepID=F1MGS3_BOVIN|nr:interactor of HORMAD1 protein 1 [Bos taurus]XP_005222900.1 interactor of HORMAD1 protein 1 isoform X1 [Bos taurus]XP_019840656.1 PREDICTED: coiled-coil domain-containing protein 36 [Bos indicus]XP_024838489.1 interactor of HORMAD1 protein 1 isoform X1 [Bos taurus]XP_027379072.1 interactor of HORMAD1 protein 1 [Bos indicus x Bos taurus]XP_027379073.1 interactor of HORMAD1 protein 1 [Bos indicus x Bos taurus]XP_059735655.1 interactor of HORMAD1 protein 1 isoform X1 [Bos taurus]XP_059735656.
MNFNVWNIKDMFSIPSGSGATKSSNWNNNQTDYSSLSDSQFLFGSQFCPEGSQTLSTPVDSEVHLRHPKQSQQNSLDSEPSIFTKYQTKPQLLGGDPKDGGLFPLPLSLGKPKGLLEQFEEKKKSAKDKCDSETLYNFISHIKESIHKLQTSVEESEEHLSSRSQSILDSLETVAKTWQETAKAQSGLMLEIVQDKGNVDQAILELQKRLEARQAEFTEMKSDLKHLEVLVIQQSKDFQQLCEHLGQLNMPSVLAELKRLTSIALTPKHVKDSASQTSPPLAQSLSFPRQDKYTSEKPVTWQAQALPAACSLSVGSPRPREFAVWGEGSKRDALQEEAVQPAVGTGKRNRQIKGRAVKTNCQNSVTKTGSENCGSAILGHKVPKDRDPVFQGDSQLISRGYKDLNNSATSIKNTSQKWQAKGAFSCHPCEQRLVTEQKGVTVERGKKDKQQPRKAPRRRSLRRKQEQMPSKTCVSNSKYPRPPVSSPQSSPWGQQETLAQPLQLWGPRSPTNLVCSAQGGTVMPSKTTRAEQGNLVQCSGHSSQDNSLLFPSFQGDHKMSWFSDLNDLNPRAESLQSQESGKNILYDLGFDSSDDGF